MPLLTPPPLPPVEQLTTQQVLRILQSPRHLAESLYRSWEQVFDAMWMTIDGVTPAMRLAKIGTKAEEMFIRNTALVEFMATQFSGENPALVAKILAKIATIPPYTVHEDGTVTLD